MCKETMNMFFFSYIFSFFLYRCAALPKSHRGFLCVIIKFNPLPSFSFLHFSLPLSNSILSSSFCNSSFSKKKFFSVCLIFPQITFSLPLFTLLFLLPLLFSTSFPSFLYLFHLTIHPLFLTFLHLHQSVSSLSYASTSSPKPLEQNNNEEEEEEEEDGKIIQPNKKFKRHKK